MTPTISTCPHCGAPLPVTRFAATVVCKYCEATVKVDPTVVSASKFRQAWAEWNEPAGSEGDHRVSIAGTHWNALRLVAKGEISDVYLAKRARWPSELALLKVVRDPDDAPLLANEWRVLQRLHASSSAETMDLALRVPAPVVMEDGLAAYRWAPGFTRTFETVREAHPNGIPAVASIWVWRRILEVLGVMHKEGLVHGALLPNHLLVQSGEHGVRLAGFSCADAPDAALRAVSTRFERFYPAPVLDSGKLTAAMDLIMSARCVLYLLGDAPDRIPPRLADLLSRTGADANPKNLDPWALHKEVGALGKTLFGQPAYHPIA